MSRWPGTGRRIGTWHGTTVPAVSVTAAVTVVEAAVREGGVGHHRRFSTVTFVEALVSGSTAALLARLAAQSARGGTRAPGASGAGAMRAGGPRKPRLPSAPIWTGLTSYCDSSCPRTMRGLNTMTMSVFYTRWWVDGNAAAAPAGTSVRSSP